MRPAEFRPVFASSMTALNVRLRFHAADDVISDRDRRKYFLPLSDVTKQIDNGRLLGRSRAGIERALMDPGMLPDIKSCQMKAKGSHFPQQWIKKKPCQTLAVVFAQAAVQNFQIFFEFVRRSVAVLLPLRGCDAAARS